MGLRVVLILEGSQFLLTLLVRLLHIQHAEAERALLLFQLPDSTRIT
jgi:hypothetical protein